MSSDASKRAANNAPPQATEKTVKDLSSNQERRRKRFLSGLFGRGSLLFAGDTGVQQKRETLG